MSSEGLMNFDIIMGSRELKPWGHIVLALAKTLNDNLTHNLTYYLLWICFVDHTIYTQLAYIRNLRIIMS